MKIINNKEYLTIKELADILQVSRVTIFKKVKSGEIAAERIGKIYILPKKQFNDVLYNTLSEKLKKEIERGVFKVIKDYGSVIKKLGEEKENYGSH